LIYNRIWVVGWLVPGEIRLLRLESKQLYPVYKQITAVAGQLWIKTSELYWKN